MTKTGPRNTGTRKRRRTLKRLLVTLGTVVAVLLAAFGGLLAWLWTSADTSTVGKGSFGNELADPAARPTQPGQGGRHQGFRSRNARGREGVQAREADQDLGFNGDHLGHTLRAEGGDKVEVPNGTTMKLALRFEGPADPDMPYRYHCHLLYHEDEGMMGQFAVVEKGQRAGQPDAGGDGGGHDVHAGH